MSPLVCKLPSQNEALTHQITQSSISDDEFYSGLDADTCSWFDRIVQVILFILFGGIIRLALMIVSTFLFALLLIPIIVFYKVPFIVSIFKKYGYCVSRLYIRTFMLGLGIVKVTVNGNADPRTRVFAFNHQTYLDGPMLYIYQAFRIIVMKEMLQVPIFGKILYAAQSIFVDRNQAGGQSQLMNDSILNKKMLPLAMSPEGKTTKGKFLLAFRTGGFITDEIIQPVTIRYNMHGAFAKTTLCCLVGSFQEHVWRCLCVPWTTVNIDFLDVLNTPEFKEMNPQQRANRCQLVMANHLGVLAIDRSSRSLFSS